MCCKLCIFGLIYIFIYFLYQNIVQQQPQPVFHPLVPPGEMPMTDLIRMLQGPSRSGEKDGDNLSAAGAANGDIKKVCLAETKT